jgi:aspartyl-tRNA(Asn)/glutamyl-tRNA(Gln) amidotransferase subunit B
MFKTGADPSHIIEEKNLAQVSDEAELESAVSGVISQNPGAVEEYKKGKEKALQFLLGKVMAATKGRANPQVAEGLLKKKLSS